MQPTELLKQGQLLRRQDRAEAIACFEESIQRAEAINDELLISNALTELAIELIEIGQTPALGRAKSLLDRSMYLLHKLETHSDNQNLESNLDQKKNYIIYAQGLLSLQEGNFKEAIGQFDRVYTSYPQDAVMQANLDGNLALSYISLGDFKTSLSYLERATPALINLKAGSNYHQLGRIYLHLDRYDLAKVYFEQSLDIALETDDKYLRVRAFIGLSQVAIAEREWENAINVIDEVLLQIEEPLDLQEAAYLYLNLAEAKIGMGHIVEAQEDINDLAIPRFEKLQNQHGLACAKRTYAVVLANRLAKGMDDITEERIEAIADEFLEALMLFDCYGTPQDKAKTLYELAYFYTQFNEPRYKYQFHGKALRSLEQALIGLEPYKDDSPALFAKVDLFLDKLMGDFGLF
jgi:tetratricopeptide (TPR) repeat protein